MDQLNANQIEFAEIIEAESIQTEGLLALLRQEHNLLQQNSPEALEQIAAVKQKQLQLLELTAQGKHDFLQRQGLSPDRQGAVTYIAAMPESSQIRHYFRILQEMLEASRAQNEINGGIVALNRRRVSNALDLLQSSRQGQKTYGRSGESRTSRLSNSFGKA